MDQKTQKQKMDNSSDSFLSVIDTVNPIGITSHISGTAGPEARTEGGHDGQVALQRESHHC